MSNNIYREAPKPKKKHGEKKKKSIRDFRRGKPDKRSFE
jgi:hypothetical protein